MESLKDQLIGGKYRLEKGANILLLLAKAHLDPVVYGDTANEFDPERMLDENFERLQREFPNSWKPFGNGARACIGRPFAWQEALLVMAVLLQNFNFLMDDPSYQLGIKETLTIKPKGFNMKAVLREGLTPTLLEHRLSGSAAKVPPKPTSKAASSKKVQKPTGHPMSIYFGSNSGTCTSLAERLAANAELHGFSATVVDSLDAANQKLPKDRPVVIVTASYEGEPPDNAAHFVSWLKSSTGKELEDVSYAVFGCGRSARLSRNIHPSNTRVGHHDWAQTFHKIPKLVNTKLEELGGTRIAPLGLADAAAGDIFSTFETWEDEVLWPALVQRYNATEVADTEAFHPGLSVEVSTPRSSTLRQDVKEAVVVEARTLTAEGAPIKKHLDIQLPTDVRYSAGDYLAILPLNPRDIVLRVMRRFQLPWDAHITISADGRTSLPTDVSVSANDVFSAYVELAQPATRRVCIS
jgi:cytochrome P450 / NADPH-cytochrome P450 reductase